MDAVLAARRQQLVDRWIEATFATYPPAAARFMASETDPFRNPAGHTLRRTLGALFDAALLADDWEAATRAVTEIVRVRAVQDFPADQAMAFVASLKPIVGEAVIAPSERLRVDARIDRLSQLAATAYEECRARIDRVRANEMKRRTWNLERLHP